MDSDEAPEHRPGHRRDAPDEARAAAIERMVRDLEGPVVLPGAGAAAEPVEAAEAAQGEMVAAGERPGDARRDRRKYLLPAEHADQVVEACRRGVPETQIARALGINYRTWMRVREEDERLATALAEVKKVEEEELVSLLLDKARKGDTTSIIFALKGRHGYRDQGPPAGAEHRTNIVINLPDALAPGEYLRMIDVTPGGAGGAP
jgi:hypothetical protein